MNALDHAYSISQAALEARARRAAKAVGLYAKKSRWRVGTIDNAGEFMLIEPSRNIPVGGIRYDMSAEEVIDFCSTGADT